MAADADPWLQAARAAPGADDDWYAAYGSSARPPAARGNSEQDLSLARRADEQRGHDYGEGDDYRPDSAGNADQGPITPDFRGRGPRGYVRSDARLHEEICERLAEDAGVDATDIEVEVHDGNVSLSGCVPDRWIRYHDEDLVERCRGVRDIGNRIAVRRGGDMG